MKGGVPAGQIPADRAREILEARARELARPLARAPDGETVELMVFRRGDERYGVPLLDVLDVLRLGPVAPVPGARPPVRGLSARRGELMVVLDLAANGGEAAAADWAVAVGERRLQAAVVADEILGVRAVPARQISAPPDPAGGAERWISGVTDDALTVIDAAALIRTYC